MASYIIVSTCNLNFHYKLNVNVISTGINKKDWKVDVG